MRPTRQPRSRDKYPPALKAAHSEIFRDEIDRRLNNAETGASGGRKRRAIIERQAIAECLRPLTLLVQAFRSQEIASQLRGD
jgi:hypothetical protein